MSVTATARTKSHVDTGILLEAGTNELEILVIRVGPWLLGVNVAKVREVLECQPPTRLAHAHAAVEGTVRIRNEVLGLVNLCRALEAEPDFCEPRDTDRMLVMEFNQERIAFRVHDVDQIVRTSWSSVCPVPQIANVRVPVTAVVTIKGKLVQMLDFEAVGATVGMSRHIFAGATKAKVDAPTAAQPIVFAEDSIMVREMIRDSLMEAGFHDLHGFDDGATAWQFLEQAAAAETPETIHCRVAGVVTDVEMPRMDGMHLTRRIRDNAVLRNVPVILFSSIVSRDNEKKGQQVGANAQVAKPKYALLVETLRELIAGAAQPAAI